MLSSHLVDRAALGVILMRRGELFISHELVSSLSEFLVACECVRVS